MDKHLEKVLVTIDYKAFNHCLGQINIEANLGLHSSNPMVNFINIQNIAREACKTVDTDTHKIEEVIG